MDIEQARQHLIEAARAGAPDGVLRQRLAELEEAIRCDEREQTLGRVRHSLNTLRGLTGFLRQEIEHSIEPLARLCEELEREAAPERAAEHGRLQPAHRRAHHAPP